MPSVLVTGSKGVIGSALVSSLTKAGHQVFGIDLTHDPAELGFEISADVKLASYARCDVAEYRELERVFRLRSFDIVYHAAAEFGRWNGEAWYEKVWRTNCVGTKNMLEMQRRHRFRAVYFSSSEVYGDLDTLMKERATDAGCRQLNDYAISKWANEQQVGNSANAHGTKSVVVRLFNTYGPGEFYSPYRSVVCRMCYCALNGIPFTVFAGHQRSHMWVGDCISALTALAGLRDFGSEPVYNIGSVNAHPIEDLARMILRQTDADPSLLTEAPRESMTTRHKFVDNALAARDLRYRDTVTLEDGVRRTLDWMRKIYRNG